MPNGRNSQHPPLPRGLTGKQTLFALKAVETGNASEAYRWAYNTERMQKVTIIRKATELMARPIVAARVAELRAAAAERSELTIDLVVQGFLAIAQDPEAPPAARVAAWTQLTKRVGGFVERHQVEVALAVFVPEMGESDE